MKERPYDWKAVGRRINRRRKELKLTQAELAEKSGLVPQFCGDIERGHCGMSIGTLLALCDSLEISPNALLLGSDTAMQDPSDKQMLKLNAVLSDCTKEQREIVLQMLCAFIR